MNGETPGSLGTLRSKIMKFEVQCPSNRNFILNFFTNEKLLKR